MKLKKLFDLVAALIGILLLWPVILLMAILIKIYMPGPVFFTQKRVGQYGKLFTMIKLRTMTIHHGGNSISVKGESRITQLGAFMRKFKIDELPGLWCVLKGDMSFVGPRPDVPGYADKLEGKNRDILMLKPGITGPASIKYSNEEEILSLQEDPLTYNDQVIYPDKVRINLEYLHRQSFLLDLKIIVYTVLGKKLTDDWV
jgi:lipopolysaccharide/colanic/teichoic acid biosynthesis glycosyltransferase